MSMQINNVAMQIFQVHIRTRTPNYFARLFQLTAFLNASSKVVPSDDTRAYMVTCLREQLLNYLQRMRDRVNSRGSQKTARENLEDFVWRFPNVTYLVKSILM